MGFTLVQNHFPNPVAANDPQDTGIGNRSEVFKVHTFQGASGTLVEFKGTREPYWVTSPREPITAPTSQNRR